MILFPLFYLFLPAKLKNMNIKWFTLMASAVVMISCGRLKEATEYEDTYPTIFPDYTFTAIPYNIAPLNFEVKGADAVRADFKCEGQSLLTVSGKRAIEIPQDQWREMLHQRKGQQLEVEVSMWNAAHTEGVRYKSFVIDVSPDAVDEWMAYRLIEPGYEGWSRMGIYQRSLTSFEEKELVTNRVNQKGCVNCHSFHQYSPNRLMFHARGQGGGTVIVNDGKVEKVELNKIGPKKNGTYPMWHPGGRYIVFSFNDTNQSFFSEGEKPLEVYDLQSDLILYDTQTRQVLTDARFVGEERWETFPGWSPDGKSLYYCAAVPQKMPMEYKQLHYALCRVGFDEVTGQFGQRIDTLYSPSVRGGSVSFPRISPDGNYLLYTEAACGTFPIWHKEANLRMFRLADAEEINVDLLNSEDTESYHAWSSNGRWILFSSRRIDGRYTRLFMAWMDKEGKLYKPFLLPQQHPEHNTLRMKSYNIPEFIKGEVHISQKELKNLF